MKALKIIIALVSALAITGGLALLSTLESDYNILTTLLVAFAGVTLFVVGLFFFVMASKGILSDEDDQQDYINSKAEDKAYLKQLRELRRKLEDLD